MSANDHAVADFRSETYPEFTGKIQDSYIEGYVPNSLGAPHSSLNRSSTWIGMGLIMSLLPPLGLIIWALGVFTTPDGLQTAEQHNVLLWIGVIATVVVLILAVFFIHRGRRFYRQYRTETGRIH